MTPVHYCRIADAFVDPERGSTHGELYVYAPTDAYDAPVIAFIHGGRFESGHPELDASALLRAGFVVVSIGYRLGLSGFAQFHDDTPAHYRGIADAQLGLEWIQKHIEHYGGDPTNVTLMGHSAGAAIALWLARRDHYRGAFRRLVALSPGFPSGDFRSRRHVLRLCLGAPITRESLSKLADSARLKRAYQGFRSFYFDGPALGPYPWVSAELAEVPILVTSTSEEFFNEPASMLFDRMRMGRAVAWLLRRRFKARGLGRYFRSVPAAGARRFVSDAVIRRYVSAVAEHDFSSRAPIWVGENTGMVHCEDLDWFLRGEGAMFSEITAFARGEMPGWPRYRRGRMCRRWAVAEGGVGVVADVVADPLRAVRECFM